MIQRDSTRFEEYITLREEILQRISRGEQILYVTVVFVFASFAWYLGIRKVDVPITLFSIFLLVVNFISAIMYSYNTVQIYRIGGFIAVFWESSDPDRMLKWHRLQRRTARGGVIRAGSTVLYISLAVIVVLFTLLYANSIKITPLAHIAPVVLIGSGIAVFLSQMSSILLDQRDAIEHEWRKLRGTPSELARIHSIYETLPEE